MPPRGPPGSMPADMNDMREEERRRYMAMQGHRMPPPGGMQPHFSSEMAPRFNQPHPMQPRAPGQCDAVTSILDDFRLSLPTCFISLAFFYSFVLSSVYLLGSASQVIWHGCGPLHHSVHISKHLACLHPMLRPPHQVNSLKIISSSINIVKLPMPF